MVERPLSMREVPGSMPGFSNRTFSDHCFINNNEQTSYYSGSAGEPESENATVFLAKRGVWSQAFHAWTEETGDESSPYLSAGFCEESFGKNRAFYVDVTYKDVDRFRKGSVHEL